MVMVRMQKNELKPLIDDISLSDEVKKHANEYLRHMFVGSYQDDSDANELDSIVTLDLWDFAGQHLYYTSHPVFLSLRAVLCSSAQPQQAT